MAGSSHFSHFRKGTIRFHLSEKAIGPVATAAFMFGFSRAALAGVIFHFYDAERPGLASQSPV